MKILLAEDDPLTRRFMVKTLSDWGHEVVAAEDGGQAWKILQEEKVKFVIADWIMPVMDGLDLCRQIRSSSMPGYVYFVLLTGRDNRDDVVEGLLAGADDYIIKPFDRNELKLRVKTGVRILQLEKELTEKNEALGRLNEKLEELVRRDALTGLGNRMGFYETVTRMHHRACRYAQKYGVIMCDIDAFKLYNDTYGHLAGDEVLRAVAGAIRSTLRMSDEVFRFGGEEIVIVLPDQGLEETLAVAEKVREGVERLGIEHGGSAAGVVTISCGASAFDLDALENRWEDILEAADKALYRAKAIGRNRVAA